MCVFTTTHACIYIIHFVISQMKPKHVEYFHVLLHATYTWITCSGAYYRSWLESFVGVFNCYGGVAYWCTNLSTFFSCVYVPVCLECGCCLLSPRLWLGIPSAVASHLLRLQTAIVSACCMALSDVPWLASSLLVMVSTNMELTSRTLSSHSYLLQCVDKYRLPHISLSTTRRYSKL